MFSSSASAPQFARGFDFLTDITKETILSIAFDERLTAFAKDNVEVGYYKCNIECEGSRVVRIHEHSEYTLDKTFFSTDLTSELDFHLETLNEVYEELQQVEKKVVRTTLKLKKLLDELEVEILHSVNEEVNIKKRVYNIEKLPSFLAYGANLVFQRLFVTTNAGNSIKLTGMDISGTLCDFSYDYLGEKIATYDGEEVCVFGMQLQIMLPEGYQRTWQKYFTMDGQLLSHIQVGLPIVFKLTKVPMPIIYDIFLPNAIIKDPEFCWEDNMELFSKFVQRKEELISEFHLYIYDHPDFVEIIKDFLQKVLMEKPNDVLNFAADFFASFSKRQILPPRYKRTKEIANSLH